MVDGVMRKVKEWDDRAWIHYQADHADGNDIDGKFMTFGQKPVPDEVRSVIRKAIGTGIVNNVKHTNTESGHVNRNAGDENTYVVCWYCSDDREKLQKLAEFLVENDMIQKTAKGRLYNMAFKYDSQTRAGEYGDRFVAEIKLENFIDLDTGKPKNNIKASKKGHLENKVGV